MLFFRALLLFLLVPSARGEPLEQTTIPANAWHIAPASIHPDGSTKLICVCNHGEIYCLDPMPYYANCCSVREMISSCNSGPMSAK